MRYFGRGRSENDAKSRREAERRYFEFMGQQHRLEPVELLLSKATISNVCEKYIQHLETRHKRDQTYRGVKNGSGPEVSALHMEKTRCCLDDFVAFIGRKTQFAAVQELTLEDYRNHTLDLPISRKTQRRISPHTAKTRLATVKALYQWGYEMRLCDLPRNLKKYARVELPEPEPEVFTVEEIRMLWIAATPRMKCFIALGLNCGYGQKDIADLTAKEVDSGHGFIERERSKTGISARHKLWKVTVELLRDQINAEAGPDDLAFRTSKGNPLVQNTWIDSKLKRSDSISCSFRRLMKRAEIDNGRSFYSLRKTGASLIERIDPSVTEMYLAHAERGMKRNYAERNWEALDRALTEAEERLRLDGPPV